MRAVLLLVVVLFSGAALAAVDYQCMQDCQNGGYLYGFCKSKCSYGSESVPPAADPYVPPPRTDYKCMQDCTAEGYLYGYCKSRCTY